jgi:uncharacterized damage-inducible protein DinB
MDQTTLSLLSNQLVKFLKGGQSHIKLEDALQKITYEASGKRVEGLPYTIWQLLQHIRFSQHDILDFSKNPSYENAQWPDDYWPSKSDAASSKEEFKECIEMIIRERNEMIDLVENNSEQLLYQISHGSGQTLLREALVLAEHNAYHLGEVIVMLRLLGEWSSE